MTDTESPHIDAGKTAALPAVSTGSTGIPGGIAGKTGKTPSSSVRKPFAENESLLIRNGYSPIPIEPGSKRPAAALCEEHAWSNYCAAVMPDDLRTKFARSRKRYGLGVACGFRGRVSIDIDTDNLAILEPARAVLPDLLVGKRGQRGETWDFYDPTGTIRTCAFKQPIIKPDGKTVYVSLVDVLADGRQTVIPPTEHPVTGDPYAWLTEYTLLDVAVEELPVITPAHIARLEQVLEPWIARPKPLKPSETIRPRDLKWRPSERNRYVRWSQEGIRREAAAVAATPKGGRNPALFRAVCATGRYAHHGLISEDALIKAFLASCDTNGLAKEDGWRACRATIYQGLKYSQNDDLLELPNRLREYVNGHAFNGTEAKPERPERTAKRTEARAKTKAPGNTNGSGAECAETGHQETPAEPTPEVWSGPYGEAKPVIKIEPGKLHEMVTDAEQCLINADAPFFVRDDALYMPIVKELSDSLGHVARTPAFKVVTEACVRDTLCQTIDWQVWSKTANDRKGAWVAANAPKDVGTILLSRGGKWRFRFVDGIVATPTLRPDGTLLQDEGYDAKTRLYVQSTVKLPAMPDRPTKADAERALKLIDDLICEFPFVDEESRSVARSAILTPVVRSMMDFAPAHVARAPSAGTGKSFLFDIAHAIYAGQRCPVIAIGEDGNELEKRLGAAGLAGEPIINIDNVNGNLGGNTLCQLVTQSIVKIRVLGKSEMPKVSNRFCLFASGNNIRLVGDMTRRALLCSMDAGTENPSERRFKSDPVTKVLANRGKYVAACLTIIRAYFEAGRPKAVDVPVNGFTAWSNTVRSALVWLGCADPVLTFEAARTEDPEREKLSQFIETLKLTYGTGPDHARTVAQMVSDADRKQVAQDGGRQVENGPMYPDLHDLMQSYVRGGKVNTDAIGKVLRGVKGKLIGKAKLCSRPARGGVAAWFVSETGGDTASNGGDVVGIG